VLTNWAAVSTSPSPSSTTHLSRRSSARLTASDRADSGGKRRHVPKAGPLSSESKYGIVATIGHGPSASRVAPACRIPRLVLPSLHREGAGSAHERTRRSHRLGLRSYSSTSNGWSSAPNCRGRRRRAGDHGDRLQRRCAPSFKPLVAGCAISSRIAGFLSTTSPRRLARVLKQVDIRASPAESESRACAPRRSNISRPLGTRLRRLAHDSTTCMQAISVTSISLWMLAPEVSAASGPAAARTAPIGEVAHAAAPDLGRRNHGGHDLEINDLISAFVILAPLIRRTYRLSTVLDNRQSPSSVRCSALIHQLLLQPLHNALDATSSVAFGSSRASECCLSKAACADYQNAVPGPYVLMTVTDTGCGMLCLKCGGGEEKKHHLRSRSSTTKSASKVLGSWACGLGVVSWGRTSTRFFVAVRNRPLAPRDEL